MEVRSTIDRTKMSAMCLDELEENIKYQSNAKGKQLEQLNVKPQMKHDNLVSTEKGGNNVNTTIANEAVGDIVKDLEISDASS